MRTNGNGVQPPVIVWFRRDLRLADHPALAEAARMGRPVLPAYVHSTSGGRAPGAASRWWLHGSLESLRANLATRGLRLVLRTGEPSRALKDLAAETGATHLLFNEASEPGAVDSDRAVVQQMRPALEVRTFDGNSLYRPGTVQTAGGKPYAVFTAFWRACQLKPEPQPPAAEPRHLVPFIGGVLSERLADWHLRPRAPDWAVGLRETWHPGEPGAVQALDDFLEAGLMRYAEHRDRPDIKQTSYLSPHLQSGDIGPRQIWHTVRSHAAGDSRFATGSEAFLRQLVWREFARELLHQSPQLAQAPLQSAAGGIRWCNDPAAFRRWTRGETGYPLVDAGMRQLWRTGWIHNRVRMVVASFLVKHLLIDWRQGEAWFWDTLVDADHASNAMNWQWVAGCGVDAAPWFRIFNPVLQGHRFDPDGAYVRQWVPELARVPARFIHQPWRAPESTLRAAGLRLDGDYPRPIVDHSAARQRALAAYSLASGVLRSPRRQSGGGTPARA